MDKEMCWLSVGWMDGKESKSAFAITLPRQFD